MIIVRVEGRIVGTTAVEETEKEGQLNQRTETKYTQMERGR